MASKYQNAITDPTMVTGARAVTDIVAKRVKADVSDEIFEYDPNANSLTLLTTKLRRKREVGQYRYDWLEKDRAPRDDAINASSGYDADDTSFVVDDGTKFYKWAVVLNHRTKERFLVSDVSSNTLTVVRDIGGTAAAVDDNDKLEILGTAYVEGADVGTAKSVVERNEYNYTQQVRTPFKFTGRDMKTKLYGGADPMTERKWQAVEHAISIEQIFWWGVRDSVQDATSAKYITFTGGADWGINTNYWDINGIEFNERNLTEFMEVAMRDGRGGKLGSKKKFLFASARYITEVEMLAKSGDRLKYVPSDKVYGLDAMVYKSAHGKIFLIDHPLFDGENSDKGFLMDLNHSRYVYHVGRDTALLEGRGDNGVDGETEEYLSDVGYELTLERSCSKLFKLPV